MAAGLAGCKPQFANSLPAGFRFDRTFGQPFPDTDQGGIRKVSHFVIVHLPDPTVRTVSDGTIEFSPELDPASAGMGDCLFLIPATYPVTLNDFSGLRALPSPASVVIMLCHLDVPSVFAAAKVLYDRAMPGASGAEIDDAAAHFMSHDEGFTHLDVRSSDATPLNSDVLGTAVGGELHLAAFVAEDSGERRYVNPLPYLAGIVPAAVLDAVMPTIDEVVVQTSQSGTFTDAVTHAIAGDTIAAELPRHFLRVAIRSTERTAAAGARTVPYGIETRLTRTSGTPQVRSRGLGLLNEFRRDDAATLADATFGRTAPVETDTQTAVFYQFAAWNPEFPAPAEGEEAFNALARREDLVLNLNRMAAGQELFPGGAYELRLRVADIAATTPQRLVRFTLAAGTRLEVLGDTNDDHQITPADTARDSLRIARWHDAYGATLDVRNAADPDNFVEQDPERFYLRITDLSANTNAGAADVIRARIGTIDGAATTNDDLTEVELAETGNATGVFLSRSQLLTTNRLDPLLPACGPGTPACEDDELRAHDGSPGGALVADNALNDRTHRADIDGSVRIVYRAAGTLADQSWDIPVCSRSPEERRVARLRVTVYDEPFRDLGLDHQPGTNDAGEGDHAFTFTDTNNNGRHDNGEPSEEFRDISSMTAVQPVVAPYGNAGSRGGVVDQAHVDAQVRRANVAWAPACIRFELLGTTFQAAPVDGSGVDILDDGLFNGSGQAGSDLVVASQAHIAAATVDVVNVVIVAPYRPADNAVATAVIPRHGSSFPAIGDNTVLIMAAGTAPNFRTLAHELGHALTNGIDLANQPDTIFFPNVLGPPVHVDSAVNSYRRVPRNTLVDVRALRPLGSIQGVGNRFLREP